MEYILDIALDLGVVTFVVCITSQHSGCDGQNGAFDRIRLSHHETDRCSTRSLPVASNTTNLPCNVSPVLVDCRWTRGIAQHVIVRARVFKKVDYPTICCSWSALGTSAAILQFQSQLNHCWGPFVIVLSVSDQAFSGLFCYVRSSSMFVS